jgi:hypothetical protein
MMTRLIYAVILVMSISLLGQSCAASKCDCPKFGGHRLHH